MKTNSFYKNAAYVGIVAWIPVGVIASKHHYVYPYDLAAIILSAVGVISGIFLFCYYVLAARKN